MRYRNLPEVRRCASGELPMPDGLLTCGYVAFRHIEDGGSKAQVGVGEVDAIEDLDATRHIIGIEMLTDPDWLSVLGRLAMAGRLAIPEKGDLL